ncbi:MAG: gamma-glutamyltransferase family protein [Hyphomicrobiales bacterium]|nr:MAG: gamma-glutamyltransferase family protein [Hyphomicrobiales bacterium]
MNQTARSYRGMVTAPHRLAAQAGLRVLEEGGNAIEAMVAAAGTIAVAYPHMNGLGGDNFWLIHEPGGAVIGIDACGAAAAHTDIAFYRSRGMTSIPPRGPLAALTVAGAVSGWQEALRISTENWGGVLPLARLLEDATFYAGDGIAVTKTLAENLLAKLPELAATPGFGMTFLAQGKAPPEGARFRQPRLAATLKHLAEDGLDGFYRGGLARTIAADLARAGSPLNLADLERHKALRVDPLALEVAGHLVYNMPPPTQGLASLILLGVFARLDVSEAEGFAYVHALIEATKAAFRVRDRHVTDPVYMTVDPTSFLTADVLDGMAAGIDRHRAAPWPEAQPGGDTVWLGAVDSKGLAVSFIQSLYWEFGSGTVLEETGLTWQNRGIGFSLDQAHRNSLRPQRRPFHTIQPALARRSDGRVMPYGTMGGEGQPQTQAMIFTRHVLFGQDLQQAVAAPRWLLGRTWGAETANLRIENRLRLDVVESLRGAGHDIEVVGPYEEVMGHAGALVHHPDGLIEGAADPRSDGAAVGF